MKNDYILYSNHETFQAGIILYYLRILDDKKLSFESVLKNIKEITSNELNNEEIDIMFVMIKNSNSFVFLKAKELNIQII